MSLFFSSTILLFPSFGFIFPFTLRPFICSILKNTILGISLFHSPTRTLLIHCHPLSVTFAVRFANVIFLFFSLFRLSFFWYFIGSFVSILSLPTGPDPEVGFAVGRPSRAARTRTTGSRRKGKLMNFKH